MTSTRHDVSEIYSPARVTSHAKHMGLNPGFALDLTTNDPDTGMPWDFDRVECRNKAYRLLVSTEPTLLIGSPMCRAFALLQNLNFVRMSKDEIKKLIDHGVKHLRFCISLYWEQIRNGRYFLHA